jgi:addiction module HigA family antidote
MKKSAPIHPGVLLRTEYLEKQLPDVSIAKLAEHIQMNRPHLSTVLYGRKAIGETLALRLEAAGFETAEHWLALQMKHDLAEARKAPQPKITRLFPPT